MRKMSIVRFAASAALLGSLGLAVALPSGVAGAAKGPVTGACTTSGSGATDSPALLGDATNQLLEGCAAAGSHVTPLGVAQVSGSTATITWLNKKITTESFAYASVTDTCSTFGGATSTLEEQETATITGGNSKLTSEALPAVNACIYIDGSNGTVLVVANSVSL
jgi:hypothetical protein